MSFPEHSNVEDRPALYPVATAEAERIRMLEQRVLELEQAATAERALQQRIVELEQAATVERALQQRIVELEQACAAERARNATLDLSISGLGEGVVVADRDGRFLVFNQAAQAIIGRGATDRPPPDWIEEYGLFRPDGRTPLATAELPLVRALAGEVFDDAEIFVRNGQRPQGVFINCVGRPLRGEHGTIVGAVVTFQDITEPRRMRALVEKFHTAAEQSTSSIVIVDRQGAIEYINPSALNKFQHTREDVMGKPLLALTGAALDEARRVRETLWRNGEFRGSTYTCRKDGGEVQLTGSVTPIRAPDGSIVNWLAIFEDTTEFSQMERERNMLEARARRLIDSNIIGVLMGHEDGRIVDANDAFLQIIGYRREDLERGLNWRALTPPEWDAASEAAHLQARSAGAAAPFEKEYLHRDGHRVPALVGVARVPESDETVAYVVDLTERKRAEQALQQSAAELARSNADLQHFASIVSHDLQEPLRLVSGFLELLRKRHGAALNADARKLIDNASEGAAGMQALIHDLLDYASLDRVQRGSSLTDASTAFDAAVANLQPRIVESGADVQRGRLPRVRVDSVQLLQVFQNLLANAIKFARADTPPQIRAQAVRADHEWIFSVTDNGIGIDAAHLGRIFTMFGRVNPRSRYPGTGIGLAITKKIVERHGGRVWVESTPGSGSTFSFALPAEPRRRKK